MCMPDWEPAVRVPLMMAVPWMSTVARTDDLAELVDLMPTLAELAEISVPATKWGDKKNPIEGKSLVRSLAGEIVKEAAYSQYPRAPKSMDEPWAHNSIDHKEPDEFMYMGYSVRVSDWRYTAWFEWNAADKVAAFDRPVYATELYDYRGVESEMIDYDLVENSNVAASEKTSEVVGKLHAMVLKQFQK